MTIDESLSRQQRLAARVGVIRSRRAERGPNDRWMLIVGGVLLPLGLALIVLGWEGVSQTVFVYDQLTYLVSGGLLGLALVVTGGFIYFTYWQTIQVRESRTHHEESQAVLLRIEALLQQSSSPTVASGTGLVATATGSQIHRADCAAVVGRSNLRPVTRDEPGLTPCKLCDPLAT
jgi:hypothetical protein